MYGASAMTPGMCRVYQPMLEPLIYSRNLLDFRRVPLAPETGQIVSFRFGEVQNIYPKPLTLTLKQVSRSSFTRSVSKSLGCKVNSKCQTRKSALFSILEHVRCSVHIRQSRAYSVVDLQIKVFKTPFKHVLCLEYGFEAVYHPSNSPIQRLFI